MTSAEIRKQFFDFFKQKNHTLVPSAPVVPVDDPTLLFTNAGMNQFKDVFLDKGSRPYKRAVDTQKCIRVSGKHNDLEEVGRDTYHHTFFEMLGNWSFGDYYKEEAIAWAWELMTEVWKLPKEKLYATVHHTDDEAFDLWARVTDIDPEHILKFGDKDNFWEMGETGPCGPCSEIHIDLGAEIFEKLGIPPIEGRVNDDSPRFIELWNLVFIQYFRDEKGDLHELPAKHVDTGMGFERVVAVLQGKNSNYDIDIFRDIISRIEKITGIDYENAADEKQVAFRVIADHIRTLTFAITDGAVPSNEGRGYVLRRILRRAARYGRVLDQTEPFFYKLVDAVTDVMGEVFPEIVEKKQHVRHVIQAEEVQFNKTLDRGLDIFTSEANELKKNGKNTFPGSTAFKLYDTYGFPMDLTRVLADEQNFLLDEDGFNMAMDEQRNRARSTAKFAADYDEGLEWNTLSDGDGNSFVGYENIEYQTEILRYANLDSEHWLLTLKETPFYAEAGGQVADIGKIMGNGFTLRVIDVQKENDVIFHKCKFAEGSDIKSGKVTAVVDSTKRQLIVYNHTATHLLHAALREVLGDHVQQAGSLVEDKRFRFDFTHFQKLSDEEIERIERIVNSEIRKDTALEIELKSFDEAKSEGAMALFGEKYGDVVRTVTVPGFSKELCGGTHVKRTGEIGMFKIILETSIASGVRRIEGITGPAVENRFYEKTALLQGVLERMNATEDELLSKIELFLEKQKQLEKENLEFRTGNLESIATELIKNAMTLNGFNYVEYRTSDLDMGGLKELGDHIREKGKNNFVALFSSLSNDKIMFCCAVTDDLVKSPGLNAGKMVGEVARITGGGGGGRPHLATAGGKDITKLDLAFEEMKKILKNTGI